MVLVQLPAPRVEQFRAAASGQAAVQVVDQRVIIERAVPLVEKVRVEVLPSTAEGWANALDELAVQISNPATRIGDRDLGVLMRGLQYAATTIDQRAGWRLGRWS